jgi:hypothetical protein
MCGDRVVIFALSSYLTKMVKAKLNFKKKQTYFSERK